MKRMSLLLVLAIFVFNLRALSQAPKEPIQKPTKQREAGILRERLPSQPTCRPFGKGKVCGPYEVGTSEVDTGLFVAKGSRVEVSAPQGKVNFGTFYGQPLILDANGAREREGQPGVLPAPNLHAYSLICRVGPRWYQGGVNRASFQAMEDGRLYLRPNDSNLSDNSGTWYVTLTIEEKPSGTLGQPSAQPTCTPSGKAKVCGPYEVGTSEVDTGLFVQRGGRVEVSAPQGKVNFGTVYGRPLVLDANGEREVASAGDGFPGTGFSKYSLICRVGPRWYQGGVNRASFQPMEDGKLYLRPNDNNLSDNSGAWYVTVTIEERATGSAPASQPSCTQSRDRKVCGPYEVGMSEVDTGLFVQRGGRVEVSAPQGKVNFGTVYGRPLILDADGSKEREIQQTGLPAPNLHPYSLICRVGPRWYQGGVNRASFQATEDGKLYLRPNDNNLNDNSGAWYVTVTIESKGP